MERLNTHMNMRHLMNITEGAAGHNAAPTVTLKKDGKVVLGSKSHDAYTVMVGDKKVGTAYGRYTAPKSGNAGGHTFQMTLKGKDFTGSKARLIAWVEKQTQDDI